MAKVSSIQKNLRRQELAKKFSKRRTKLKNVIMNRSLLLEERFAAQLKLQKLPLNSNENRVRNRCQLTGRARGFYKKFGLSRNKFREYANLGRLPGVVKSSW